VLQVVICYAIITLIKFDEPRQGGAGMLHISKHEMQRVKGLLMEAGGNVGSLKGAVKSPSHIKIEKVRALVRLWQESGREILEILEKEEGQEQLFDVSMNGLRKEVLTT